MKSRHDGIGLRVESAFDHAIEDDLERSHARGKRHFPGFAVGEHPSVERADHWVVSVSDQCVCGEDPAHSRSAASDGRRRCMVPMSRWMGATLTRGTILLAVQRAQIGAQHGERKSDRLTHRHARPSAAATVR